jgi:hypothetical protein
MNLSIRFTDQDCLTVMDRNLVRTNLNLEGHHVFPWCQSSQLILYSRPQQRVFRRGEASRVGDIMAGFDERNTRRREKFEVPNTLIEFLREEGDDLTDAEQPKSRVPKSVSVFAAEQERSRSSRIAYSRMRQTYSFSLGSKG